MALEAGQLTLTLQFAKGLKDKDLFGRQDPYAVISVGSQTFRSRTHTGWCSPLTRPDLMHVGYQLSNMLFLLSMPMLIKVPS